MAVDLLDLAKAFAGPVATIIAASTAAWITYRLGREQVRIAGGGFWGNPNLADRLLLSVLHERRYPPGF